jgi:hypothetical protein
VKTIEAETVDGTPIVLGKDRAEQLFVDEQPVTSITNTPLGVILMCPQRGYTIGHVHYFQLLALDPQ